MPDEFIILIWSVKATYRLYKLPSTCLIFV